MKRNTLIAILPAFILGVLISNAYSSSKAIKQRMIERLPVIKLLKEQGLVGENNTGYLEFVGKTKQKADVIEAENKDRKLVYNAIANQQGTILTTPTFLAKKEGEAKIGVNLRWYLANSVYRKAVKGGTRADRIVFLSLHADSRHPGLRCAMVFSSWGRVNTAWK